jgi:predicted  nucleic acid-binding Zn-ribbon protein
MHIRVCNRKLTQRRLDTTQELYSKELADLLSQLHHTQQELSTANSQLTSATSDLFNIQQHITRWSERAVSRARARTYADNIKRALSEIEDLERAHNVLEKKIQPLEHEIALQSSGRGAIVEAI